LDFCYLGIFKNDREKVKIQLVDKLPKMMGNNVLGLFERTKCKIGIVVNSNISTEETSSNLLHELTHFRQFLQMEEVTLSEKIAWDIRRVINYGYFTFIFFPFVGFHTMKTLNDITNLPENVESTFLNITLFLTFLLGYSTSALQQINFYKIDPMEVEANRVASELLNQYPILTDLIRKKH